MLMQEQMWSMQIAGGSRTYSGSMTNYDESLTGDECCEQYLDSFGMTAKKFVNRERWTKQEVTGAFLAAAVWGGQWGGHIFIWGAKNFG